AGETVERALHREGDLLVLAVESQVRGQEPFLRGVPRAPAPTEVEQQPSQIQGGARLGQVETEETVGDEVLRDGDSHALVAAQNRDRKHRKVFAFHQPDGEGGPTGPLPRHPRLRAPALPEIDQLRQLVAPVRIDGGGLGRLEHSDVVAEVGGSPVCAWRRRDLTAVPLGYRRGARLLLARLLCAGGLHAPDEKDGAYRRGHRRRGLPNAEGNNHHDLPPFPPIRVRTRSSIAVASPPLMATSPRSPPRARTPARPSSRPTARGPRPA